MEIINYLNRYLNRFLRINSLTKVQTLSKSDRSEVSLVKDRFGRKFVLKEQLIMDKNDEVMYKQEAEILKYLSASPNCNKHILCYYDFQITNNIAYLLTNYINGEELFDFFYRCGRYLSEKAKCIKYLNLFIQIVSVVQELHHLGIVHRDLKLENIIVQPNGNIVLIDFGFACFFKEKGSTTISESNIPENSYESRNLNSNLNSNFCSGYKGTLSYAGPESFEKKLTFKNIAKSDVYALGVIFYIIITAGFPYKPSVYPYYTKNAQAKITNINIPDALKNLVNDMILFDPNQRPNIDEVVYTLNSIANANQINIS